MKIEDLDKVKDLASALTVAKSRRDQFEQFLTQGAELSFIADAEYPNRMVLSFEKTHARYEDFVRILRNKLASDVGDIERQLYNLGVLVSTN